jgi:hypothetical protein
MSMPTEIASQQASTPVGTEGSTPHPETPAQSVADQDESVASSTTTEDQDTTTTTEDSAGSVPAKKARIEVSVDTIEDLKTQRKRRQEAEREAAYWRGVAEGTVGRGGGKPSHPMASPEPQAPIAPPRPEEFADFATYEAAKEEYLLAKAEDRAAARLQRQAQETREESINRAYQERIAKAAEVDPEITDILNDDRLPINVHMGQLIKESEQAPSLIRYFHENRKIAMKVYDMPPLLAAREIGRIESMLEARDKSAPPPKKVSAAPAPIPTVGARGTQTVDEESLPVDDWMKRRNAQQFGRKQ